MELKLGSIFLAFILGLQFRSSKQQDEYDFNSDFADISSLSHMSAIIMSADNSQNCSRGQAYVARFKRCCTVCPKGHGVALPCDENNDTECAPCAQGVEYSAIVSYSFTCTACDLCPTNSHKTIECNSTQNVRCLCNEGFFGTKSFSGSDVCQQCKQCETGQKVIKSCTQDTDTRCDPCPKGHFSNRTNSATCRPCKKCQPNEVEIRACTASFDTVCVSDSSSKLERTGKIRGISRGDIPLSVYCFFLALIPSVLLLYVLFKWKCSKKRSNETIDDTRKPRSSTRNTNELLLNTAYVLNHDANGFKPESQQSLLSYVNNNHTPVKLISESRKVSDHSLWMLANEIIRISTERQEQLWIPLANKLGYKSSISMLDEESSLTGIDQTHLVLRKWNEDQAPSAVLNLIQALKIIGCPHLTPIVCELIAKSPNSSCLVNI